MYIAVIEDSSESALGSLYSAVIECLKKRNWWNVKISKKMTGRFHLIIGEAQASNIPYKLLSGYNSLYPGICPMCNFYRGFKIICRKVMMAKTLRQYLISIDSEVCYEDICPETYLFYPSKPEDSERNEFIKSNEESGKVWILKPSDGSKGNNILIKQDMNEILDFLDTQEKGTISWVVQRYIENPLLIPTGLRKFDIRIWVLLDTKYNIYVYSQGVLRVSAVTYNNSNYDNIHMHLSNHCIAETHPEYGKYESTNEIFFNEFNNILNHLSNNTVSLYKDIMPQIYNIIKLTLLSVKDSLYIPSNSTSTCGANDNSYKSFQVFGYDFMLTSTYEIKLIEINSSPAVANDLVSEFAEKLTSLIIDTEFPPDEEAVTYGDSCSNMCYDERKEEVKVVDSNGISSKGVTESDLRSQTTNIDQENAMSIDTMNDSAEKSSDNLIRSVIATDNHWSKSEFIKIYTNNNNSDVEVMNSEGYKSLLV